MVGQWKSVDSVVQTVLRDRSYYLNSGGGVTFSGGEPTAQPDFLLACASECKKLGIHTALDTCGYAEWQIFDAVLPAIDLVLYDVKHLDPREHLKQTGVGNEIILANLRRINRFKVPIWLRVPLIPGYNDSIENIEGTAALAKSLHSVERVTLLSYNAAAGARYPSVGRQFSMPEPFFDNKREREIMAVFSRAGVNVELRN